MFNQTLVRTPGGRGTVGQMDAPHSDDSEAADRRTASLTGLAVTLLLIVIGLSLIHNLHVQALLEDCLLAGRLACGMP